MSQNKQSTDNNTSTTMMGDGPSRCNVHGFETTSVDEWNKHCEEEGHTESGVVQCNKCHCDIPFQHIPYQKQGVRGKDIQVRCANCKEEDNNLNSLILRSQQERSGDVEA